MLRIIKNYSDKKDWELLKMLPHDLKAEKIVILPDVNPGKAPLPTGCVVKIKQDNWRKFALSDVGCGMLLLKSKLNYTNMDLSMFNQLWNNVLEDLRRNKGKLGDLGSGNHFLDAIRSLKDNSIYFLIHTGSRDESGKVEKFIDNPNMFDKIFFETCQWAEENRLAVSKSLEKYYGKMQIVIHNNHNHFELIEDDFIIIRKGAIKLLPGNLAVIPSHMTGEIVLVKGKNTLSESLFSLSHGTGRLMSRSEAKDISKKFNYDELRNTIYIPSEISNDSIKTDAPFCYRTIDEVMVLLDDLIEEVERYIPFAYIGHI